MPTDPTNLTPDQRRREIAAILAKGVLRLRSIGQTAPSSLGAQPAKKAAETLLTGLDNLSLA